MLGSKNCSQKRQRWGLNYSGVKGRNTCQLDNARFFNNKNNKRPRIAKNSVVERIG